MEIKKLADIFEWADAMIRDADFNEEKYKNDGLSAYCHAKAHELWRIRDVALESMERHAVYTSALNNDIADKAAKIELLEKEIEGRKEGYIALKKRMDTDYISIDEHNDVCKAYEKKIEELEKQVKYLEKELEKTYKDKETDLKNHQKRDMALVDELAKKNDEIKDLKESINRLTMNCRAKNTEIARLAKENAYIRHEHAKITAELEFKKEEDDYGKSGFKRYIEHLIEEEERAVPERFKERLNQEITEIFTKEEETEVNDIPCGEDAIE